MELDDIIESSPYRKDLESLAEKLRTGGQSAGRETFSSLRRKIEESDQAIADYQYTVKQMEEELKKEAAEKRQLLKKIELLLKKDAVTELDRRLEEAEQREKELRQIIKEQAENIRNLNGTVKDLNNTNKDLNETVKDQNDTIKDLNETVKELNKKNDDMGKTYISSIDRLSREVSDLTEENRRLTHIIEGLSGDLKVSRRFRFGKKSQKGTKAVEEKEKDREEEKEDFDGTQKPDGNGNTAAEQKNTEAADDKKKEAGQSKKTRGKYKTMSADEVVNHPSDQTLLPEGALLLGKHYRNTKFIEYKLVEHRYEILRYMLHGEMREGYFPAEEDASLLPSANGGVINRLKGTHASAELLAELAFDKYLLNTPLYKEEVNMECHGLHTKRTTLWNWLDKGADVLERLLPELKKKLLADGAVVNCDETWARVRKGGVYRKKYIWCMVNPENKTVVFFYDEGSRSRDVLRDFLGDANIKALQSDGYNVYAFLDGEDETTDHLCCMAHARAKFKYALDEGADKRALEILEPMNDLYIFEREYKEKGYDAERITQERQGSRTMETVRKIKERLDRLLEIGEENLSPLLAKAARYLSNLWDGIFLYLKDGRYNIDNNPAERCIRPLTRERKASLFYGGSDGVRTSVLYHTFIQTCWMSGVNALEYFKKLFRQIISGRDDYQNLLPCTIGINKKS